MFGGSELAFSSCTLQKAAPSVVNYSNEKFSTDMVTNNRSFSKETFGKSEKIN
jgi:hypothetical protein